MTLKKNTGLILLSKLGFKTVNYHTLKTLNRGHGLAEFIDSVIRAKNITLKHARI